MTKEHLISMKTILVCFLLLLIGITFCSCTAGNSVETLLETELVIETTEQPHPPTTVEVKTPNPTEKSVVSIQTDPPQETKLPQKTEPSQEIESLQEAELTMTYIGQYRITGYDICIECCGKTDGITASGTVGVVGRTVAANNFQFGTRLYIDGIGERVVEDRGGMQENTLDVLCIDHAACYAITGYYDVYIIEG